MSVELNTETQETQQPPVSVTTRLVNRTGILRRTIWNAAIDLTSNQVYTFASAIAFNALLSFFPFIVLLLVICRKVLLWPEGYELILSLLKDEYMPAGGQFITRNLRVLASTRTTALFSLGALFFTAAGLFVPIELALNRAWGVTKERNLVRSQAVALGLVLACGLLAMGSIYITASSQAILRQLLGTAIENPIFKYAMAGLLKVLILPVTVAIFFLIYYFLPNCAVPLKRVLPAAIFVGLLWELLKYIFVWSLPLLDFASVYGPFYITVSLVMWAFFSSMLLLLGANLSANWPE